MKKHVDRMSCVEIRMLRWMCSKTRKDSIKGIRDNLGGAQLEDKMRETSSFVQIRRPEHVVVRKSDSVQTTIKRKRGRPRETRLETTRNDFKIYNLTGEIVLNHTERQDKIM